VLHHIEQYKVGILAVDGRAVTFGIQHGATWAGCGPAQSILAVPNVTAHPSTASVPISLLLYNGPLLFGFNNAHKGLSLLDV